MITAVRHPPPTPPPEPVAEPVIVISQNYVAPYMIDLNVKRKTLSSLMESTISVNDINGDQWFKVIRGQMWKIHERRLLLDVAHNPLLTFQHKLLTARRRWVAYRGDSIDPKDVLFTVRQSSLIQVTASSKTKLAVFMAGNMEDGVCDFYVKGSDSETSCDIFIGGTKTMIAQMHRSQSFFSGYLGKDNFTMSIRPNVDYAFIVSLVILEEINAERKFQELMMKSVMLK